MYHVVPVFVFACANDCFCCLPKGEDRESKKEMTEDALDHTSNETNRGCVEK